jgi:hypothetical protein
MSYLQCVDLEERFIRVLQYLSRGLAHQAQGRQDTVSRYSPPLPAFSTRSAHCRYNPVLGEFFRCRYDYPNDTQGFFIAEQGGDPPHPNVHIPA